jgi:predicted acetyltransferase
MARKITDRQLLVRKMDSLSDPEVKEVLDYISIMESMRQAKSLTSQLDDDLVTLLTEAYENKRARQAYEWETVRRRTAAAYTR